MVRWSRRIVWTRRGSSLSRSSASPSGESTSGPSLASAHQPALRSVPYSLTRTAGAPSNRRRTTAPFGLVTFGGSSMSTRPPWDRWTSSRGPPNSKIRYFPRRPTPSSRSPMRLSGGGTTVFRPENESGTAPAKGRPATAAAIRSPSAVISGSSGMPGEARGSSGGDRLRPGGPSLQLGQPVVLLQPATGQAGAGGGVGARLPGRARLESHFGGLLAHERPP